MRFFPTSFFVNYLIDWTENRIPMVMEFLIWISPIVCHWMGVPYQESWKRSRCSQWIMTAWVLWTSGIRSICSTVVCGRSRYEYSLQLERSFIKYFDIIGTSYLNITFRLSGCIKCHLFKTIQHKYTQWQMLTNPLVALL